MLVLKKEKMSEITRCDRCGYGGSGAIMGSNGLCPLCGGKMRVINYSQSFVVKKGWRVFKSGGMERVVVRQTLLEAFA